MSARKMKAKPTAKPAATWGLLRRLFSGYLARHKGKLAVAIFCMIIVAACTAVFAHLIQPLFDEVFVARNLNMLFIVPAVLLGVNIIKGIASYVQSYLMEFIGQRMVADLQGDLYAHTLRLDGRFFQQTTTGELTARFIYDLHRLNQALSRLVGGGVRDVTMVLGLTANLFIKDWQLAAASLILFPLAAWPIGRFGRLMRKYSGKGQQRTGLLTHILNETFGHQRQVKVNTAETREISRAHQAIEDVFETVVSAMRIRAMSSPVMEIIGSIAATGVILYGGYQVYEGGMTPGAFMSFLTSLLLLFRPIKGLTNLNNALQEGLAAAERTFTLLDTPNMLREKPGAAALVIGKGEIGFKNVQVVFGETKALDGLDLTIAAGKVTALVGPSGAGKSTALNLVPRLLDPDKGTVTVDGQDVKTVQLESLRTQVALVSQDIAIFDDTVAANIAYGRPEASMEEVITAAKQAAAHDFIENLPEGYATRLGENGARLSGGQRQRLSIARAFLKNAPVLLLDEVTSQLDAETERHIQTALEKLMKGRTTLMVAHRLTTVKNADAIYVLENGKVVENGAHAKLLAKKNGVYARLWQLQQGEAQQGEKA